MVNYDTAEGRLTDPAKNVWLTKLWSKLSESDQGLINIDETKRETQVMYKFIELRGKDGITREELQELAMTMNRILTEDASSQKTLLLNDKTPKVAVQTSVEQRQIIRKVGRSTGFEKQVP